MNNKTEQIYKKVESILTMNQPLDQNIRKKPLLPKLRN